MKPTQNQAVKVPRTPADVLRAAADYIERHGWTRGSYYATTTGTTPPACAVGAIGMACYGRPVDPPQETTDPGLPDFDAAFDWLDGYLHDQHQTVTYDFNDSHARTADEVVAALRAAADEWDRQHLGGVR